MRAQQQTIVLAVALVGVVGLDLGVRLGGGGDTPERLEALPPFALDEVERVTLGATDDPLVLERRPGGWWIVAPSDAAADDQVVEAMLRGLSGGVVPEARIDESDHERYGLSGGRELRIDVFGQGRTLSALYLGHDAGGGSTWVRWPDAPTVYRARIGGRATYERSPRGWRDRTVTAIDPAQLTEVQIEGASSVTLSRGEAGWSSPSMAVDGPVVEQVVASLAGLRGLEVAAPGLIEGPPRVRLSTATEQIVLGFEQVGELWFVGRGGADDRWRSPPALAELIASAPASLRDRPLWGPAEGAIVSFERLPHGTVGRGLLERGGGGGGGGGGWVIRVPANVDIDPGRASAVVAWLARPRVDAWIEAPGEPPGFDAPARWRIRFEGGEVRTIEIGARRRIGGIERVAIRDSRRPDRAGWVDARIVAGIEAPFGG